MPREKSEQQHLVDYIFMVPPGCEQAEKIALDLNNPGQIARLMVAGYQQVFPQEKK